MALKRAMMAGSPAKPASSADTTSRKPRNAKATSVSATALGFCARRPMICRSARLRADCRRDDFQQGSPPAIGGTARGWGGGRIAAERPSEIRIQGPRRGISGGAGGWCGCGHVGLEAWRGRPPARRRRAGPLAGFGRSGPAMRRQVRRGRQSRRNDRCHCERWAGSAA